MVAPTSDINDDKDTRPFASHSARCDLGFLDGYAGFKTLAQFYTNQAPANRWFPP